ncbi:MAG: SpoIIE family protein phosphatase, partial [Oscillospiraceae bacterium]|nr:SpoIIE family protein phosphatase [Oscillospiraceae bacterium]
MAYGGQWRLAAIRSAAEAGRMDRRFLTAARCAIFLLLGMVMAGARVLGDRAPFGVAMVACSGAGLAGASALGGAVLTYLLGGGLEWGVRYAAAAVLAYTVAFVFHELSFSRSEYFMPTAAGAVTLLTGLLGSFYAPAQEIPLAAALFLETVLAFGGAYFFRAALTDAPLRTESAELRRGVSLMIFAACALMSFSRLVLFRVVSLGRFFALLLVMASAMKGGMLTGAAAGTVLGLAMDISSGGTPFYAMAYAFSGLLSGVFGKHGRLLFTLSFILSGALAVVCAWNAEIYISALFETFCASVIFMILPASWLNRLGPVLQPAERGSGESGLRRFAARRVKNLSEAYAELFEIVRRNVEEPYNDENVARIFDRAADAVCVRCREKNRCWNAEYLDTLSAMNDATHAMVANGTLTASDLPGHFRERCIGLPAFVTAVNGELRALSYRRQLRTRLSESRNVAWAQYTDMAQVLGRVADELGSINGADPAVERRMIRYLRTLDIDADAAVYRDGGGRLHAVIESGRLTPLTKDPDYLEKLSAVAGVRLCQPEQPGEDSARLTLLEAEPLAVSVGIASLKKRGEKVSGDRGSYFKTDAGVLCILLSDGMGCGDEAARDSDQVVSILEKFLRSGVDPAVAMKILNSVMLLRGGGNWGFATVDLMCVDLFSGETCFYKYGAAPSYVKNGRSIRRIKGEALAAGLSADEGIAPDVVRMRLRPGSLAVIDTDGVIADADDGWLKATLESDYEDMKALARAVLKEAERLYGAGDDMTVVTVRVEAR